MVERDAKFDDIRPYYEEEIPAAIAGPFRCWPLMFIRMSISKIFAIRYVPIAPCAIFSSRLCVVSMSR